MTDQKLREMMADLIRSQEETARAQKETDRQLKETDRRLQQLGKQMGELGNKFGSFAEGMALPSMEKILYQEFGMNVVAPRHKAHRNGRTLEVDVLAYDTGARHEAYVIEIKSRLDQAGIEQLLQSIADLPDFVPLTRDRKIYGIIAAVDIPTDLRNVALKQGLYVARLNDDIFKLAVPRGFKPRAFGPAAEQNGANGRAKTRKKRSRAK